MSKKRQRISDNLEKGQNNEPEPTSRAGLVVQPDHWGVAAANNFPVSTPQTPQPWSTSEGGWSLPLSSPSTYHDYPF